MTKRIGIDFDNTIIDYDAVFLASAKDRRLVDRSFVGSKRMVRDSIRLRAGGEVAWRQLQGYVYGTGIADASLFDGADAFLKRCQAESHAVFIVSHKTEFSEVD